MVNKESLINKFDEISGLIPQEEWKYFHLEAIDNFIFHLNEIESERTRQRISQDIESCLNEIREKKEQQVVLVDTVKELFGSHIFKISGTYKDELGFIQKPYWPLSLIIAVVLFFVTYYFSNILFSIIFILIISSIYFLYVQSKIKSRKYY